MSIQIQSPPKLSPVTSVRPPAAPAAKTAPGRMAADTVPVSVSRPATPPVTSWPKKALAVLNVLGPSILYSAGPVAVCAGIWSIVSQCAFSGVGFVGFGPAFFALIAVAGALGVGSAVREAKRGQSATWGGRIRPLTPAEQATFVARP